MAQEFRGRFEERMRGRRGRGRGEGFGPPEGRPPRPEAGERRGPPGPPRGEGRGPRSRQGRGFGEEMRQRMHEAQQEAEGKLAEILDEEQMGRLREIAVQAQLERGGPMALLHGKLGDSLGVTDEQRNEIRDRAREMRRQAGDQMREIRRAHQEELLDGPHKRAAGSTGPNDG